MYGKILKIPLFFSPIPAGFPGITDDFIEQSLDLNEHLIKHPSATFFVRVAGNSMTKAGIHAGDMLVVDKSLLPHDESIVIASIDGEFTVKRLSKKGSALALLPENPQFRPIPVEEYDNFEIWGVVTHVIHSLQQRMYT